MAILDLHPLSADTIQELKLSVTDLWIIKIDETVYGPFETHSLKHYAAENEEIFIEAWATHPESEDWVDFESIPVFMHTHVTPEPIQKEPLYSLMINGHLTKPIKAEEVCKYVGLGKLILSDHVSLDEGHSWFKINELEEFSHLVHSQQELPQVPSEECFQKGRQQLVQHFNMRSLDTPVTTKISPPSPVFGQMNGMKTNLDEYSVPKNRKPRQVEVAEGTRKLIPMAMSVVVAVMALGYFLKSPSSPSQEVLQAETARESEVILPERSIAQRSPAPSLPSSYREPSSYQPMRNEHYREAAYTQPDYPTVIETHDHNESFDQQGDQFLDPVAEGPEPVEHSLVAPQASAEESLDAAMNHAVIPLPDPADSPIVEASDL